ncbi:MAG: outer membrane beta-barrel protein [Desulfarculaceae bacterium]|nr:outer membrane beta-barrel protein [Desulfarculaceae bacterium]
MFFIAAGLCLVSLLLALPGPPARAAIITPSVNVTFGYSDNVRLTQVPRSDFYLKAGPGLRGQWKWHEQELTLFGNVMYAHYLELEDLNGFDSAAAGVIYKYQDSPRWTIEVNDLFNTTFDKAELGDNGELVTVRNDTGRIDRNSLTVRVIHKYAQLDSIELAYTNTYTKGEDNNSQTSLFNRLYGSWNTRLNPHWELRTGGSVVRTDYNDAPDEDRGRAFTRLTRLMGPTQRVWGELSYTINQAVTETNQVGNSRNYQITALSVGTSHSVSPRLDYTFSTGWSYVNGDEQSNNASNQGFPTLNADVNYRGKRWRLRGYASADLGQFDYLGDNSGLTVSHRAGLSFNYDVTRLQSLLLSAEYARNDYQEDPLQADTANQGVVNSYRFTARYSWQVYKHWRLSLEYSYLNRDAEVDADDRQQNQVLLVVYTDYPFRW